jgi:hypothetical protein
MKKQNLENQVLHEFGNQYSATKGNIIDKKKGGLKGSYEILKDYVSTSEYTAKQYQTKNKITIKNKKYYQKTMDINKTVKNFGAAGISLDQGIIGKLTLDLPRLGKQDFDIMLDKDPLDPKKYQFNSIQYKGLFHFSYP